MSTPKISMILPVYNVAQYLPQCLDSLINQTLTHIEIIAVNDGSTDNSLEILIDYQSRFPEKLKVFTIENQGVSHARNYGYEKSCGEYIWFVDSDDYVELNACEILYRKASTDQNDLVLFQRYDIFKDGERKENHTPYSNDDFSLKDKPYEFTVLSPFPWNKLIHRDLFRDYAFPEGIRFEDLPIAFLLAVHAKSIGVVDQCLYNYRIKVGFLGNLNPATLDIVKAVEHLRGKLEEENLLQHYQEEVDYVTVRHFFTRFEDLLKDTVYTPEILDLKKTLIDTLWDYMEEKLPHWKENHYVRYTLPDRFIQKQDLLGNRMELLNFIEACSASPEEQDTWLENFFANHPAPVVCADCIFDKPEDTLNNPRKIFEEFCDTLALDDSLVFLQSDTRHMINPEVFHLLLIIKEEYPGIHCVLSIPPECDIHWKRLRTIYHVTDTEVVYTGTRESIRALATAKYLATDSAFSGYYCRREGQVILSLVSTLTSFGSMAETSRTTPKYMHGQRNLLISDYILCPWEKSLEQCYDKYDIPGCLTPILKGTSPAMAAMTSCHRRDIIRKSENIENQQVLTYVPFSLFVRDFRKQRVRYNRLLTTLYRWDMELDNTQILYVHIPPNYNLDKSWDDFQHIRLVPSSYELFDFLSAADVFASDFHGINMPLEMLPQNTFWFNHDYYAKPSDLLSRQLETPYGYLQSPVKLVSLIKGTVSEYQNSDKPTSLIHDYCNTWLKGSSVDTSSKAKPSEGNYLYFTQEPLSVAVLSQMENVYKENQHEQFWFGFFYKKSPEVDELLGQLPKEIHLLLLRKSEITPFPQNLRLPRKIVTTLKLPKPLQVKCLNHETKKVFRDFPGNIHFQRIYCSKDCDCVTASRLSHHGDEIIWL